MQGIDRDEVQRLIERGGQLVEVLPRTEYQEEHLPGSVNIPLKSMNAQSTAQLDKQHPTIVYCWDYQ